MKVTPKMMMWVFGLIAIGGLALFLALFQSSPGPLSSPHAKAVPGSSLIRSCSQCHADDGLASGCLSCHSEIAAQLDTGTGFHTYLRNEKTDRCESCHPEHHGADFPLVSDVSWQGIDSNAFNHPHVEFRLTGKHDQLTCDPCHSGKLREPFALDGFPGQIREHTMLGLNQDCISCHRDVHESGEKTRDCTRCHNQNAFKPAPFFSHDQYYLLEGPHAKAACASCHQQDVEALPGKFGPVKGKACADCHQSPHRFGQAVQKDCLACHLGTDETWSMGERGVDTARHADFGFKLEGAHMKVECAKCHSPKLTTYAARFPDPASTDYTRSGNHCSGCHQDPHHGQFAEHYAACSACHTVEHFKPPTFGLADHPQSYPLKGGHQAVACTACHTVNPDTNVRQFKGTATACRDCHNHSHGTQFDQEIARNDCTACHAADFSTFRIRTYKHQNMRAFFLGKGHAKAACVQCHAAPANEEEILQYRTAPVACASCHTDIHRGQFRQLGQTECARCHGSFDAWTAGRFNHDRDSAFKLDKAHAKVACVACHQPVPQQDGQPVIQYRPLTKKCEDCHGFQKQ